MNKFMKRKKISPNLQMKIRQYLRFIWQEELTQNVEFENAIIEKLSRSLKEELFLEANGSILNKYSMFFANFSEKMLRSLMHKMKEVRFNPEDQIFSQNSPDDCEIYFILKGKVEIFLELAQRTGKNSRQPLQNIKEGEVFGELSFFTGLPRSASAKSKDFCSMIFIKREDFLNILQKFPEDYEKYCLIRDQISTEKNFNSINASCYSCKAFDHLIKDCPLFHFIPKFQKPILKTLENSRKKFERKRMKTPNPKKLISPLQIVSQKFRLKSHFFKKQFKLMMIQPSDEADEKEIEEEKESLSLEKYESFITNSHYFDENSPINRNHHQNIMFSPEQKSNLENDFEPIFEKRKERSSKLVFDNYENEKSENSLIDSFDKMGQFKMYCPNFNFRHFVFNYARKKSDDQKNERINIFQAYFSRKTPNLLSMATSNLQGIQSHVRKSYKEGGSNIFSENQLNYDYFGKKQKYDFYDLVYEVLTNHDLRKKLSMIRTMKGKKKVHN